MRILVWLALIVLVIFALRKKSRGGQSGTTGAASAATTRQDSAVETMVCCAHCQIYLPASEAVYRGQQSFCSAAHADLH